MSTQTVVTNDPTPTSSDSPYFNRFILNLTFGEDGVITGTNYPAPSVSHLVCQGAPEDGVTSDPDIPVAELVINIEPPLPLPAEEIVTPISSTTNLPSPPVNRLVLLLNLRPAMASFRRLSTPGADGVITETNLPMPSTTNSPSSSVIRFILILNPGRRMASLRRLWAQLVFGEDGVVMPGSDLSFVIAGLYNFMEVKAQGQSGFPFTTHHHVIMVAVSSLIMFGLASAAQRILSTVRYGAPVARFGKMVAFFSGPPSIRALRSQKLT